MASFFRLGQEEVTRFAIESYFSELPHLVASKGNEYLLNFARYMFPNHLEETVLDKTDHLLKGHIFPQHVFKPIMMERHRLEQRIAAKKLSENDRSSENHPSFFLEQLR